MAKFIHLEKDFDVQYPVGRHFNSKETTCFVYDVAEIINNTFPTGDIALVVRGTSGSILAGGIGTILKAKDRNVIILVCRKPNENYHGSNMDGFYDLNDKDRHFIVVDDFVASGDTVISIIDDLSIRSIKKIDMLCISNRWDKTSFFSKKRDEDKVKSEICKHFKYICCNKP